MKTGIKSFKIFLPQINAHSVQQMGLFESIKDSLLIEPLKKDWQQEFCETVGYPGIDLPWTQLRLSQFNINSSVKTACCIDPVMMHLTHKGAYMMGQDQLNLEHNDALRIVAQINEQLMETDENIYLVDKHAWLFTSHKSLSLISQNIQSLIGKDMFNFSYQGSDALYWKQFSMEIQMLIKQMCDYQGLVQLAPETLLNVHCFDLVNLAEKETIPFINNDSITVMSENEIIKTFCCKTFLTHKNIADCFNEKTENNIKAENNVLIAFDSEKELYPKIIRAWVDMVTLKKINSCQIICQDAVISLKPKDGFFKSLLAWFK